MFTLIVVASMLPAFFWVWYFYRLDHRKEPVTWMVMAFIGGAIAVIPVYFIQGWLIPFLPTIDADQGFLPLLFSVTIAAGFVEEFAKFVVVLAIFAFSHDFDEPVDGLIYAISSAMGFTMLEDFLKHTDHIQLNRIFSAPGHAMFAVFWGYAIGQQLIQRNWLKVAFAFFLSAVAHGLWDAIAFKQHATDNRWALYAIFPMSVCLFWWLESRLHYAQQHNIHISLHSDES